MNTKKIIIPLMLLSIFLFTNQIVNAQDIVTNYYTEEEYNYLLYQINELNNRVDVLSNNTTGDIEIIKSAIKSIEEQLQNIYNENFVTTLELETAIANAEYTINKTIEDKIQTLNNNFNSYITNVEQNSFYISQINKDLKTLQEVVNSLNYVSKNELEVYINDIKNDILNTIKNNINALSNDLDALSQQTIENYEEYRGTIQVLSNDIKSIYNIIESFDFVSMTHLEESMIDLKVELLNNLNNSYKALNERIENLSSDVTLNYESLYNDIINLENAYNSLDYVSTEKFENDINDLFEQLNVKLTNEIVALEKQINNLSLKTADDCKTLSNEIVEINNKLNDFEILVNSFEYVTSDELEYGLENLEQKLLAIIQEKYTLLTSSLKECMSQIDNNNNSIQSILNTLNILETTVNTLDFVPKKEIESTLQALKKEIDTSIMNKVNEIYEEIARVSKNSIENYEQNCGEIQYIYSQIESLNFVIESLDYVSKTEFTEYAIALKENAYNEFSNMIKELGVEINSLSVKFTNDYEALAADVMCIKNDIIAIESTINYLDFATKEEVEENIKSLRVELVNELNSIYEVLNNKINNLSDLSTSNFEKIIADIEFLKTAYNCLDYVSNQTFETIIGELTMEFYSVLNDRTSEIDNLIEKLTNDNTLEHKELLDFINFVNDEVSNLSAILNSYTGVTAEFVNGEIEKVINECQTDINKVKDELNNYFTNQIDELNDKLETLSENIIFNYETIYEEIDYLNDEIDHLSNIIDNMDYVSSSELNESLYDLEQNFQNILNEEINKINEEIANLKQADTDNLNSCLEKFNSIYTKITIMDELIKKSDVVEFTNLETQINETKEYLLSYIDEKILLIQDKINQQEEEFNTKFEEQKNINSELENKINDLENKNSDSSKMSATTMSVVSLCGVGCLSFAGLVRLLLKKK